MNDGACAFSVLQRGERGFLGPDGVVGRVGSPGIPGPRGELGPVGDSGVRGVAGVKGLPGAPVRTIVHLPFTFRRMQLLSMTGKSSDLTSQWQLCLN